MGNDKKTTLAAEAAANVTTEVQATEVQATEVQATEVQATEVQATEVQATEVQALEVELIPEGVFVADNGNQFKVTVNQFAFKGSVFTKEEAIADAYIMQELIALESFIVKKV